MAYIQSEKALFVNYPIGNQVNMKKHIVVSESKTRVNQSWGWFCKIGYGQKHGKCKKELAEAQV